MSWNFRKVGNNVAALKLAIEQEGKLSGGQVPPSVVIRIFERINAIELKPGQAILVESDGHYGTCVAQPTYGSADTSKINVLVVPFIDTPVDTVNVPVGHGG